MSLVAMVNLGKGALGITQTCRVLEVSKSSYYDQLDRSPKRALRCRALVSQIQAVFEEHLGNYGSPRIHRALRTQGVRVSRQQVASLMRKNSLVARQKRRFRPMTTDSNHSGPIARNLLQQDFSATSTNQVWVGDISVPQQAAREMRDRPLAIGLQGQVANHRKRLGSKALVVSVTEKAPRRCQVWIKKANNRELPFSCRNNQMTSKPGDDVAQGLAWRVPVYWPCGVRHRGSASLIWALVWNCGNLRLRCKGKGTSYGEADSTNAQSRGGATRSSVEAAVMAVEQRGRVIKLWSQVNRVSGRSLGA
jgi:hypothetical protein